MACTLHTRKPGPALICSSSSTASFPSTATCIAAGLAALRPNRVRSLVLVNGFARFLSAPDHSSGADPAFIEHVRERVLQPDHPDGPFDIIRLLAPNVADDVRFRAWWDRTGRRAASPATARSLRHVIESARHRRDRRPARGLAHRRP
jgi:pimeloyl-ACP methyl ester carboxylesterase